MAEAAVLPGVAATVKGRYTQLEARRLPYLERARECSKYTLPSLVPPAGYNGSNRLPTPYQSMGARGVNNLSSKLQLALLPPNAPFFRLAVDDFTLEALTQKEGMRAEVEKALNKIERAVMSEIESSNPLFQSIRTSTFICMKHLLVAGNILVHLPLEGGMRVFPLDRYVVKRGPMGNVLEIISKEDLSTEEIPEAIRATALGNGSSTDPDKPHELYTHIKRVDDIYTVSQEINGVVVPGSRGTYPLGKCPWIALRFQAVDNADYGPSFVEEYLGDIKSLETLTKAIVQGSAAAAKVLFLVRPNGTTKARVLAESESGDIREGNADDVTVLQLNKAADFRVAQETRKELIESLSFAFLLNSAVQRNGERVTAEEIRYMAGELEQGLGGVYSTLSQDFQLPLVGNLMHRLEDQKKLPRLPEGKIKPMITTGIEAIGRGNDLNKLKEFFATLAQFGPEAIGAVNMPDAITRLGTSMGIDTAGLIKSKEQIAQEKKDASMMQMAAQLGPNAVTQLGGMAKEVMAQQPPAPPTQ